MFAGSIPAPGALFILLLEEIVAQDRVNQELRQKIETLVEILEIVINLYTPSVREPLLEKLASIK